GGNATGHSRLSRSTFSRCDYNRNTHFAFSCIVQFTIFPGRIATPLYQIPQISQEFFPAAGDALDGEGSGTAD
ncbi:MAG: hypothetical protein LUD82_01195, partial [Clostridiales bacterium]|nr:hypothetical protein [Clostridiales bacterium]